MKIIRKLILIKINIERFSIKINDKVIVFHGNKQVFKCKV